jgi:hypothetical protein
VRNPLLLRLRQPLPVGWNNVGRLVLPLHERA